ncbi:MAG: prolipoprotein diacylglyceryl transferase [Bacteroidaceae bacterium]|nr:prolipoprotein diacylglyceryl transferase [Bacteroidaceae bacterium]
MTALPCHIIWNPDTSPFSIFGFEVRYYSLCWVIALMTGYYIMQNLYKKQNVSEKLFEPLFMYCFVGILLGARLGHCLFYEPAYYLNNIAEMFLPIKITPGGWHFIGYQGLASHGGTLGLMIALVLYHRKTKLSIKWILDNIAITTPIVAAAIRVGNFMNSEILGRATDSPFGIIFAQVDNVPRHPAQLYEAAAYIIFFIGGWFLYKKFPKLVGTGFFFGYCLFTIFTFRFFVEFLKEVQVDFEQGMTFDMGQWLSIPFIIMGVASIIYGIRQFKKIKAA